MDEVRIKNYDVIIARFFQLIFQLIFAVLVSYLFFFIAVLITGQTFISPSDYYEHILLFDAKPIALILGWGVIAIATLVSMLKTSGQKIKNSAVLKTWLSFKSWALSLGNDFE
ncbi:MAG: hypothetical protein CENE_03295 [Candidatus Celerinatantimonas neptuna]|nr:MAG: hypothetical protein CENE_03295 [Candidatus Celerinatantimonas neptuna]